MRQRNRKIKQHRARLAPERQETLNEERQRMTKPAVYLETSVISYATSRPSRDLVVAARHQITRDWLALRSAACEMFVPQLVATEASGGDEDAAREWGGFLQGIPRLRVTDSAGEPGRRARVQGGRLRAAHHPYAGGVDG